MIRCQDSAGRWRVALRVAGTRTRVRAQIMGHRPVYAEVDGERRIVEQPPSAATSAPYEGELCAHELIWLQGTPGKDYARAYAWTFEPIDKAAVAHVKAVEREKARAAEKAARSEARIARAVERQHLRLAAHLASVTAAAP